MSKIGRKPIILKEGTSISEEGSRVVVRGPKGEVTLALPENLKLEVEGKKVFVKRLREDKKARSVHGTFCRLITNAIWGTTSGFEKTLEIVGTGFRGQMEGETLVLTLGFSHPIRFTPPPGIKLELSENKVRVLGVDKEKVGLVADKIRKFNPPEPYKGKGIRMLGEKLRLKPGKAIAKGAAIGAK